MLGMYYQQEILHNSRLYSSVLPKSKGFKNFEESAKTNPVHQREEDGEYYVRVYKKDPIMVRVMQQMEWKTKLMEGPGRKLK